MTDKSEYYNPSNSRFRAGNGNFLTRGLFYETVGGDKSTVLYTLKDFDHHNYPSLSRLYIEESDPTEYLFAKKHLDSWAHWEDLLGNTWFEEYITRWRRELEVKIKAQALVRIFDAGRSPDTKTAFAANKYLLEGRWTPSETKKVGRPTKEAIAAEAQRLASINDKIKQDYERLVN